MSSLPLASVVLGAEDVICQTSHAIINKVNLVRIRKKYFSGFNADELKIFRRLSTPKKIQDFLEKLPINFDVGNDTCRSPLQMLRERKAHCIEGAFFATAALWFHGQPPLLMDLKSVDRDYDHVVALFRKNGNWGAISKTNHAVLRYREPIYRAIRELALSFFHEYFLDDGRKTMRSFSKPFNLSRFAGKNWLTSDDDLWYIAEALDESPHYQILSKSAIANLRRADPVEIEAGKLAQWTKK